MCQELKIYEITHRDTGEVSYQPARTAEEACKQAGLTIGDCNVRPTDPRYRHHRKGEPTLLVKIPCETCHYQYAECKKPAEADCPTRSQLPELVDWLKQAAKAHLCTHQGEGLTKEDYQKRQKWVPIEDAIRELTPKA